MNKELVTGTKIKILPNFAFDYDGKYNPSCAKEVGKTAVVYDIFEDGEFAAEVIGGEMVRLRPKDYEVERIIK